MKNIALNSVVEFLDSYCKKNEYADFGGSFNGLQFANSGKVTRIATAVDSGLGEIEQVAALGADLLIVHHGMYWDAPIPIVGANYKKIKTLVDNDIAVYSMHLPLDAHEKIGNNVLLANALDLKIVGRCFAHEGKNIGVVASGIKGGSRELEKRLANLFPNTFKAMAFGSDEPEKIAICSGSCGDVVPLLREQGFDTLICGELRQRHFTMAQEMELNLYPCGHYATERFGVMALGELAAEKFGITTNFIEMPNPL